MLPDVIKALGLDIFGADEEKILLDAENEIMEMQITNS